MPGLVRIQIQENQQWVESSVKQVKNGQFPPQLFEKVCRIGANWRQRANPHFWWVPTLSLSLSLGRGLYPLIWAQASMKTRSAIIQKPVCTHRRLQCTFRDTVCRFPPLRMAEVHCSTQFLPAARLSRCVWRCFGHEMGSKS